MIAEIEGLGHAAIDPKALERWRAATQKDLALEMADTSGLALALGQWIALGDWRTLFAYRDAVAKVSVADVQRVASAYFVASNRTVGVFVPTDAPVRAPATEAASAADYVQGLADGPPIAQGEAFPATIDHIDERTTRGQLAGGIATALLAKKTRLGKVTLQLRLHWGDEKSLAGKRTAGDLMGALMMRGTKTKTYIRISRTPRIGCRRGSRSRATRPASRCRSRRSATSSCPRSISRPRCSRSRRSPPRSSS